MLLARSSAPGDVTSEDVSEEEAAIVTSTLIFSSTGSEGGTAPLPGLARCRSAGRGLPVLLLPRLDGRGLSLPVAGRGLLQRLPLLTTPSNLGLAERLLPGVDSLGLEDRLLDCFSWAVFAQGLAPPLSKVVVVVLATFL